MSGHAKSACEILAENDVEPTLENRAAFAAQDYFELAMAGILGKEPPPRLTKKEAASPSSSTSSSSGASRPTRT